MEDGDISKLGPMEVKALVNKYRRIAELFICMVVSLTDSVEAQSIV